MKKTTLQTLFSLALAFGLTPLARAENNAFTYQGKLVDDCCPATGIYDFIFKLYDMPAGGTQLPAGSPITRGRPSVPVTNGLFTVKLDFTSDAFAGQLCWLQIEVRTNNPLASFATLLPRTELTPTPYAVYAAKAGMVANGAINTLQLAASAVSSNILGNYQVNGLKIANGSVVRSLNGLRDDVTLTTDGTITLTPSVTPNGGTIQLSANGLGSGWGLSGNGGTTPGVNFLGTTDGRPLELRAPFVGVNRTTPITGSDSFSVRSPVTGGYGGMYVDTAGIGLPFYGYAMQGQALAWHYVDGADGNKWKLYNSGDRLTVTPGGFTGINRSTQVTSAEYFGVRAPVTNAYGGMYVETSGRGLPFYGYAMDGGASAWHYVDGSDGNKWKLYNSGDHLTVAPGGNVGVGTTTPQARLDVAGEARVSGLTVAGGSVRVPGAGVGTATPAFVQRASVANIEAGAIHRTTINHPLTDNDPNVILLITPNYNPSQTGGVLDTHPVGVWFHPDLRQWQIYHQNFAPMEAGAAYNVLIIKP